MANLGPAAGWRSAGTSLAGIFGALGTLAGVIRRDRGGGPQFVHTSIWNTALWWNWRDVNTLANLGHGWNEYQSLGARYGMYRTADDRALLVCPLEQKFWEAFCDVASMPEGSRERGDWTHGMDFGSDDEIEVIAGRIATKSLAEWTDLLHRAEVPCAPVLTLQEALESDHARMNDVLRGTTVAGESVRIAASPVRIHDSEEDATVPGLGRPVAAARHRSAHHGGPGRHRSRRTRRRRPRRSGSGSNACAPPTDPPVDRREPTDRQEERPPVTTPLRRHPCARPDPPDARVRTPPSSSPTTVQMSSRSSRRRTAMAAAPPVWPMSATRADCS